MASSSLLRSPPSDDEITLNTVSSKKKGKQPASIKNRIQFTSHRSYKPLQQHPSNISDNEDDSDSDLEAPASLLVDQHYAAEEEEDEEGDGAAFLPPPSTWQRKKKTTTATTHKKDQSTRNHVSTFDRTMWRWTNVENMDDFFQRVYAYYQGKGLYCILLARLLNLLTLGFVIFFSTFLIGCVDYSNIKHHTKLSEIVIPQCYSRLSSSTSLFLFIFVTWWIWEAVRFIRDIPALKEMHNFYEHLLEIPDKDMQTISWQQILSRIIDIRETNPNTSKSSPIRLDAHDVANRIMRTDNYLIALFNKDILNITIPVPYLKNKYMFTRDLEWNLSFCLLSYVFDHRGQLRKRFLREKNKILLVKGLQRRFIFMGLLNLVFAPFILVYLVVYFFFRYFEEFRKNPGEIGSRSYSPFAKWKFREFNELPHLLKSRISSSYPIANKYIDQFPKEKTALLARFIAFITGSIGAVLLILTLFDSEALTNFEITENRTVFFYIGIVGAIFEVTRRMIPDEHLIFEPETLLRQVVEHTHYFPSEWHGQLHSDEVRAQFCQLFDYKVSLFLQELVSVVFTPLILCVSLPLCAEQIIDFFREFSVHVDGLGYVCSFAQFDFARHGNVKYGAPVKVDDDYYLSKEGKMEKSFINFKTNNPDWEPTDLSGSIYLSRLAAFKKSKPNSTRTPLHQANNYDSQDEDDDVDNSDIYQQYNREKRDHSIRQQKEEGEGDDDDEQIVEPSYSPTQFAFQRTHFVPTIHPTSLELSEPNVAKTRLNQYGVPEGRIPSNLGDSFEKATAGKKNEQVEIEEDDDNMNQVPGMIGLLNQFYDLNNNPKV